ncbi:MAG: sortase [Actinomycetota bacterium]|nr:sortase [Actinomycetota bacterium]
MTLKHANRRAVVVVAALVVLATAFTSTAIVMKRADAKGDENPSFVAAAPATSTTTVPPTTVKHAVTTTTEPLPVPEPPPTDAYAAVPVVQIGSISIPKIGLEHPIFEGVTLTIIDHGPGHWPGSALPGHRGNAVFPGHRVTHSHPFLNLDLLAPGDEVTFHMHDGDFTYSVTGTQIVRPTDLWVLDQTNQSTMTLIACHPKHSAAQRIVVKGKLVRSVPSPPVVSGAQDAGQRAQRLGV